MTRAAAALGAIDLPDPVVRTDPKRRVPVSSKVIATAHGEHLGDTPILHITRGDAVALKPIRWVWHHYLAGGKLHLIGGPAGVGKTTCAMSLCATATTGGTWPDGLMALAGHVLIWSGEDDIADTLAPKLIALGADMARVHFVASVTHRGSTGPFDPAKHLDALQDMALRIPSIRIIVVDPIVSAVKGDSHNNGDVRRGLAPLQALAERTDAAVIGITHFTKGTQSKDPVERITGSLAFAAAARVVFVAARRKDQADQIFMRAKSNVGPIGGGFTYQTEQVDVVAHPGITASIVTWTGAIEGEAREVLYAAEAFDETSGGSKFGDAKSFLSSLLADGAMETDRIRRECEGAGHAWATIRRAMQDLSIEARKELGKGGRWKWALPTSSK